MTEGHFDVNTWFEKKKKKRSFQSCCLSLQKGHEAIRRHHLHNTRLRDPSSLPFPSAQYPQHFQDARRELDIVNFSRSLCQSLRLSSSSRFVFPVSFVVLRLTRHCRFSQWLSQRLFCPNAPSFLSECAFQHHSSWFDCNFVSFRFWGGSVVCVVYVKRKDKKEKEGKRIQTVCIWVDIRRQCSFW